MLVMVAVAVAVVAAVAGAAARVVVLETHSATCVCVRGAAQLMGPAWAREAEMMVVWESVSDSGSGEDGAGGLGAQAPGPELAGWRTFEWRKGGPGGESGGGSRWARELGWTGVVSSGWDGLRAWKPGDTASRVSVWWVVSDAGSGCVRGRFGSLSRGIGQRWDDARGIWWRGRARKTEWEYVDHTPSFPTYPPYLS